MNNTTEPTAGKSRFHQLSRVIESWKLPRAQEYVLIALLALASNDTLTTDRFPVTIARLCEKSRYSKTHTLAQLNALEQLGRVERIRRRVQREDGSWTNLPTTYVLRIPDAPAQRQDGTVVAQSAPFPKPSPRPRPVAPPPHPEPDTCDLSAEEEAELSAAYEAHLQALADEMPDHDPSEVYQESTEPEPIPVDNAPPAPEPEAAPLVAQSPQGFTDEEQEIGDAIVQRAQEKLRPLASNPMTHKQAMLAWSTIVAARYTIGRYATEACTEYKISEKEILACVDEWIAKCVLRFNGLTRQQLALRLRRFFHDKGRSIIKMRNSDRLGLRMLA